MIGDKLTRFNAPPMWRCPISLAIFATVEEQVTHTSQIIKNQGADLTLTERRAKYSEPTPAAL